MSTQLDLLAKAEQHFHHQQYQAGASLVWDAAFQALAAAAPGIGLPCSNREEAFWVAIRLDEIKQDEYIRHMLYLSTAELYLEQANNPDLYDDLKWEPCEFIENLTPLRDMVASLVLEPA